VHESVYFFLEDSMAALVERSDQFINLTALTRRGSGHFENLAEGKKDRFVVMNRGEPIAVVLNISSFEMMLDEMEQLRIEVMALHRIGQSANDAISSKELQQRLGV